MNTQTNIPLSGLLTMRIGGAATQVVTITSPEDARTVDDYATTSNLPLFIVGGGSNIIGHDEGYNGVVAHMAIKGFATSQEDADGVTLTLGAGEIWDEVVAKSVEMGLSGIEAMSAIPGTCGAAPVQNVGAYGQEIADTFISLDAYDRQQKEYVTLTKADCGFGYRHSIFRGSEAGRYVILAITIRLNRVPLQPPFYAALQRYLDEHQIVANSPAIIRNAVVAIRASKLPDPSIKPNSGSFFKNALVAEPVVKDLLEHHPDAPHYLMPDGTYKVPSGWLIEKAGLKGKILHGMRVNPDNALVLINESANTYANLAAARQEIITTVRDAFGITIEQEPLEISHT